MPSIDALCDRMRYWAEQADLGYDQGNRWDIRPGGECDCSSLVYWALWEAGFLQKPSRPWEETLYTGTMRRDLTSNGWVAIRPDGNPRKGDIILNEQSHVCVCIGGGLIAQASIDENGNARGGASGDQTGRETNVKPYYTYSRGWDWYLRYSGDGGEEPSQPQGMVARLQEQLNEQTRAGLSVDGEWGPLTMAAASRPAALLRRGDSGEMTRILQEALNANGFDCGAADSIFGLNTLKAVTDAQISLGLEVDGVVGGETWKALLL